MKNILKKQKKLLLLLLILLSTLNYWFMIIPYKKANNNSALGNNNDIPPSLAVITIALGPFRGLIADALWWHVADLQEKGNYFEIMKISSWITAMQPENPFVWTFHAWNMAYNIADEFPTPDSKWEWVFGAIQLLRNDALSYTPNNSIITDELSWIILNRIAEGNDKFSKYYRNKWIKEMSKSIETGSEKELKSIIKYIKNNPNYLKLKTPEALRIKELTVKQNLNPEKMLKIEKQLGPFNWRLPIVSALYWIYKPDYYQIAAKKGDLNYETILDVALFLSFLKGEIVSNPKTGLLIRTNNFEISNNILKYYKSALKIIKMKSPKNNDTKEKVFKHKVCELFANIIPILKLFNKNKLTEKYFEEYKRLSNKQNIDLKSFINKNLKRITYEGPIKCKQSIIEAYFYNAYRFALNNQYDELKNSYNEAEKLWKAHQKLYGNKTYALPPIENIKTAACTKIFKQLQKKQMINKFCHIISNPKDILYIKDYQYLTINNINIMDYNNANKLK